MTPDHGLRKSGATLILAGTIGLGAMSCAELSQLNPGELRLETVPTASHLVSDGNALLRIEPLFGRALPEVSVSVNGVDVTDRFRPAPDDWLGRESDALLGLIDGLVDGDNEVVVSQAGRPIASPRWFPGHTRTS